MSTLIKMNGIPTFKSKNGFRYPHFWEYYKIHDRMHWTADEISLSKDMQDFEAASQEEKDFITNVMRLFTQNEIQVGYGYATLLRIFKPVEVQAWLASANAREYTHIENYSLFTESIGLGNEIYSDFINIPVMSGKAEYLEKAKVKKYEDYRDMKLSNIEVDNIYRKDIARMLAVYAGGTENVSLMAQFAALLKYQFEGKYPGLCAIVEFSIKEETLHGIGNSHLFRDFINENKDIWDGELRLDINEALKEMVSYEHALVDYLNPPHMKNSELKQYIEYRANIALEELGMDRIFSINTNPLEYMDDVVGTVLTDFFSGTVTEYSQTVEGDWDDIEYDKWKD